MHRFSTVDGLTGLADELYAITGFLVSQPRLRRNLADPAASADGRAALASDLFEGKVSASTLQVVHDAVSLRWSSPWDLLDAVEAAGDEALFAAAERNAVLDEVEDELFRFERVLSADGELVGLLDDQSVPVQRRRGLLEALVAGKVQPETLALLQHALESRGGHSVTLAVDNLLESAAERQNRYVARVISAIELTERQEQRLRQVLSDMYGRDISVRTAVDPAVQGGLVIRVGDEVIDGSVAARITRARAALAG
jgi:F-type H+-transporting ATPase subunit delta